MAVHERIHEFLSPSSVVSAVRSILHFTYTTLHTSAARRSSQVVSVTHVKRHRSSLAFRLTSVACGGRGRALTWRVAGRTGQGTLLRWRAGTGRGGRRGGRADAGGSAAEVSLTQLLLWSAPQVPTV